MRDMINKQFDKDGQVEAIVKALKKVEEEALNIAPRKGILKTGKLKQREEITDRNIVWNKRRKQNESSEPSGRQEAEPDMNDNDSAGES